MMKFYDSLPALTTLVNNTSFTKIAITKIRQNDEIVLTEYRVVDLMLDQIRKEIYLSFKDAKTRADEIHVGWVTLHQGLRDAERAHQERILELARSVRI